MLHFSIDIQFDYSNVPSAQIQNVPKKLIGLKVDVHDTGIHTQTAGRIKRLESEVGDLFFAKSNVSASIK